MMYREIIAVCSQIHTKHINTLCGQKMESLGTYENCEKQLLVSSVCPSVFPHGTARLPLDGFSWNLVFVNFSRIFRENSCFIKI